MTVMSTSLTRESLESAIADLDREIRATNIRHHQQRSQAGQFGIKADPLSDEVYHMHARRRELYQQLSDLIDMSRSTGGPGGQANSPKQPENDAAAVAAEIVRLGQMCWPRTGQYRAHSTGEPGGQANSPKQPENDAAEVAAEIVWLGQMCWPRTGQHRTTSAPRRA